MQHMKMREKALIYFCFMLTLACALYVINANAQTIPWYYGYVDNYNNSADYFHSDATLNFTKGYMELAFTGGFIPPPEDFTSNYVETHGGAVMSQTATRLTWVNYNRINELAFVYTNHPESSGGTWSGNMYWTMNITSIEANAGGSVQNFPIVWVSVNSVGDYNEIRTGNHEAYGMRIACDANQGDDKGETFRMSIFEYMNGVVWNNGNNYMVIGTPYYFHLIKSGTSLTVNVYNDTARTLLFHTFSLTLQADHANVDNLYPILGYDTTGSRLSSGWIEDLYFDLPSQEREGEGYIESEEITGDIPLLLDSYLINTSIPALTTIQVQFSDDNATWVDNEGNVGWYNLTCDKEYIDLTIIFPASNSFQYRVKLNGDGTDTPIVYDSRLLIEDVPDGLNGNWIEYNVSSVNLFAGTPIHGNITSMAFKDGKTFRVEEIVSQTPAVDARVNFTGIPNNIKSLSIRLYDIYDGNPSDVVNYEAFNFSSNGWVIITSKGEGSYEWTNQSLSIVNIDGASDFIEDVTGNVWFRMHEPDSGVTGHYIEGDYIRLRGFTNTTQPSINITNVYQNVTAIDGEWVTYPMHTVTIIVGTNVWGNLANLTYVDGLTMFGHEEAEIPAMLVYGNFTIPKELISGSLHIYGEYIGNPAHDIKYEVWNFNLLEWQLLGSPLISGDGWVWQNQSISLDGQYRQEYNNTHDDVWIRLIHTNQGVITHSLEVDYVGLHGLIPVVKPFWWIGAIFISVPVLLILYYALRRK